MKIIVWSPNGIKPVTEQAVVRSKAVVRLLLISRLMYFPLFVEVLCLSLFCYELLCVHSSFAIILKRKRKICFAIIALQMYCYNCYGALRHGAVG